MSIISKLDEIFNEPEKVTSESLDTLVQEAVQFLKSIQEGLASKDEAVREKAMKDAEKMQLELNAQVEKMQTAAGIDPSQYLAMVKEPSASNSFSMALKNLQRGLMSQPKKKKQKRVKEWLAS